MVNRKERFEKLKALCDEGLESEQIAKRLGMTRDYCRKELKGRGLCAIDMHTKPGKAVLREDSRGHTLKELANKYVVSESTMRRWLAEYGLKAAGTPRRGRKKEYDLKQYISLLDKGLTQDDAARIMHVSKSTLNKRLQEEGISRKGNHKERKRGSGVNCLDNPRYSESCIYGEGKYCMYVCHGMGRRPCPAWDCTCYRKKNGRMEVEE